MASLVVLPFLFVTQCQAFGPLFVTVQVFPYLVVFGLPSRVTVSVSSPKTNLYWLLPASSTLEGGPLSCLLSGLNFRFPTKESSAALIRGVAQRPSPVKATSVAVVIFIELF